MSKYFQISGIILLLSVTACSGGKSALPHSGRIGSISPMESSRSLAPAAPGNADFSPNDEAPIIRDENGIPMRKDAESQSSVLYFSGFNEE